MPAHKFSQLLGRSDELRAITLRARRLMELQQVYEASAPAEIARASHVAGIKAGVLVLCADYPAVAAKLKQLLPRITENLRQRGAEINGIRVEVQVKTPGARALKQRDKAPLPVDLFEKLSEQVREPGLKSALTNIIRKRRSLKEPE